MYESDLKYWAGLVVRRRSRVLQVTTVLFAVVVMGTLLWPPVYRSTAKILVLDNRAQYLISPDLQPSADRAPLTVKPVSEEDLNSEVELLTSTYLIKQSIVDLTPPSSYGGPACAGSGHAQA